jgi:superfamily II DNA or RNA helicase
VIPKWSIAENLEQYPEFANINTEVYFLTYNAFREELDLSDYDYIIFDECHHLGSLIFGANALKSCKGIKTIGLTATNKREDNIDVTEYFDKVAKQYFEMLAELKDFENECNNGLIEPEKFEQFKEILQPLKNNYMMWSYAMYLLNLPNREKKVKIVKRRGKNLTDNTLKENNDVLNRLKTINNSHH